MPAAKRPAKKSAAPTAPKKATAIASDDREVDAYFARQPADQRALLDKLRALVVRTVPDATVSIKWGVPVYARNGKQLCALASFKDHVGLNFFAPPAKLIDPAKKLEGGGKISRMLKVRSAGDIDAASIQRWLKAAAGS
ncbi:MAG TPA: DUF1801 domain-containing protein [Candidatus Limnocylindria bacterium]|jgi:hypothetical protein|nr:DUF1801 domain-containing protein [Candidatus Limnocylindria bacterium]